MPRNAAGVYTLPNPPRVPDTVIDSPDENTTRDDIGAELTNSLDRNGRGGMLAPFRIADGTLAAPGVAFLNEPGSGLYRIGPGSWAATVQGVKALEFSAAAVTVQKPLTVNSTLTVTGAIAFQGSTLTLGVNGATSTNLSLSAAAGQQRQVNFQTNSINRWIVQTDSVAESGGNAGSNFNILARTDTGTGIDTPFSIERALNGRMTVARPTSFTHSGAYSFGAAAVDRSQVRLGGTFTSGGSSSAAEALNVGTALIGAAGDITYLALLATSGSITTGGAGEGHALLTGARFVPPTITLDAGDTVTQTATVTITGPTTGAASQNYGLLLQGSTNSLRNDGAMAMGGSVIGAAGSITFNNTVNAVQNLTVPSIYGTTTTGGAYPYNEAGHLVLEPRLSGAVRHVVIAGTLSFINNPSGTIAGTIARNAVDGLGIWGVTGSSGDFAIYNNAGSAYLRGITGSADVRFPNGSIVVGSATQALVGTVTAYAASSADALIYARSTAAGTQRAWRLSIDNATGEVIQDATGAAAGTHVFRTGGTTWFQISSAAVIVDSTIPLRGRDNLMLILGGNTADGADTAELRLMSTPGAQAARGAYMRLHGNENVASNGGVTISAGDVAGGNISIRTGADVTRISITQAGDINTLNSKIITGASAAARAGLNLPHGAAPSAPVNGDMWTTTAGLFVRINGVTVGPLT